MKLCKSYRSTYEITEFAQRIAKNEELEAIERHGEEPAVALLPTEKKEIEWIETSSPLPERSVMYPWV